jgi:hypothetical protein
MVAALHAGNPKSVMAASWHLAHTATATDSLSTACSACCSSY